MPLFRARVNLAAITIKGYSVFPKTPALLEPNHLESCQDSRWKGLVLPLFIGLVGLFYNLNWLGYERIGIYIEKSQTIITTNNKQNKESKVALRETLMACEQLKENDIHWWIKNLHWSRRWGLNFFLVLEVNHDVGLHLISKTRGDSNHYHINEYVHWKSMCTLIYWIISHSITRKLVLWLWIHFVGRQCILWFNKGN